MGKIPSKEEVPNLGIICRSRQEYDLIITELGKINCYTHEGVNYWEKYVTESSIVLYPYQYSNITQSQLSNKCVGYTFIEAAAIINDSQVNNNYSLT